MTGSPEDRLAALLDRLARLLDDAHEARWARAAQQLAGEAAATSGTPARQDVARRVLGWYAGAGSFNDLVLQDEHGVLPGQAELDGLRARIFETARSELS